MRLVNATKIVKDSDGKVTHRIPFAKYVLSMSDMRRKADESADDYANRIESVVTDVDKQLTDAGWNGRTDYVVDASDDGDGSVWDDCKQADAGSLEIKATGLVGALNNGIDLAIRAAVLPKKLSAKQVVEHNRKLALAWAANHAATDGQFMSEFVGKIANGSDNAADWVLNTYRTKIDGLL